MLTISLVILIVAVSFSNAAIDWQGNWAFGCDWLGNDLSNVTIAGSECGTRCSTTSGCTHFTWTSYLGGTCFLKKGTVSKSDAIAVSDQSFVCGLMESGSGGGGGGGGGGGEQWNKADLTWYTSYPDPGSEECIVYNGCTWAGYFAFVDGKQTESWVRANNIIAIHERDTQKYKLKTFRLRQGNYEIDARVYDMCSDSDCNGCCTKNAQNTGFLIDIEKFTKERFGSGSGVVEWRCLDC